ncbi:hypothetical protein SAMN04515695_0699, partial [Pseudovibrio sp. Tun.PSC04-5.I4]
MALAAIAAFCLSAPLMVLRASRVDKYIPPLRMSPGAIITIAAG